MSDLDVTPPEEPPAPRARPGLLRLWWQKLAHTVRSSIIGLDDTPQRIAFGVFLGFVVGATPTLGFQIVLYLAIATLLRTNKVSGLPPIMLSNPVTAVPLYYFNWRVGHALTPGPSDPQAFDILFPPGQAVAQTVQQFFTVTYWQGAGDVALRLVAELWLGSVVVGVICGVPAYFATIAGVRRYRAAQAEAPGS